MPFDDSGFASAANSYFNDRIAELPTMDLPTDPNISASTGYAALVGRNGQIEYESAQGYANLEHGSQWGSNTVSGIRSLSKEITAAAMLKALNEQWWYVWQETQALNITSMYDLPIVNQNLFPTVYNAYHNTTWPNEQDTTFDTSTTIGQIMSHTSGAAFGWGHEERPKLAHPDNQSHCEMFFKYAYCGTPGAIASYGDQTPWLIGTAIADLTGQEWYDYVAAIFANAGMDDSYPTLGQNTYIPSVYAPLGPGVVGNLADAYTWDSNRNSYVKGAFVHPDWGWCIGGIYSTTHDMYKYYQALTGLQIVNASLFAEMNQAQTGKADNPGNEWIHPLHRNQNYPLPDPMGDNYIGGPYSNNPNHPNYYLTKGTNLANWGYGTTMGVPINGHENVCIPGGFGGMYAGSVRFLNHDTYIIVLSNSFGGARAAYEIAELYEQYGGLS